MLVDFFIILIGAIAVYRGRQTGFIVQFFAGFGFFGGLLVGSWLQRHTISFFQSSDSRTFALVITTLGCAVVGLLVGQYVALHLKHHLADKPLNKADRELGAAFNVITFLLSIWLIASFFSSLPSSGFQTSVRSSRIITQLNRHLPPAPTVIANLGRLISPNGFPDVFIGNEPIPSGKVNLPALGDLSNAVNKDKASVVRIKGQGCGGIVSGSGFVIDKGLIATNAHVIAGIQRPIVQDSAGSHSAKAIWFDPDLDFAILRISSSAGQSLALSNEAVAPGTPSAVLGYPGGGEFSAGPAAVMDQFKAKGRNIYGTGRTLRDVYELQADIVPGNSGGPVVAKDGSVLGMVFAESTNYNNVGYALTNNQIKSELKQAKGQNKTVSTGQCAD